MAAGPGRRRGPRPVCGPKSAAAYGQVGVPRRPVDRDEPRGRARGAEHTARAAPSRPRGTCSTRPTSCTPSPWKGVVHHLDLTLEVPSPGLSAAAYELVVEVLTGLLGAELPAAWSAEEAVLKGTGRQPLSDGDRRVPGSGRGAVPLLRLTRVPSRDGHRHGRRGPGGLRADGPAGVPREGDRPDRGGGRRRAPSIVVFPEAFIPGTPIWIDSRPIWDGDEQWFAMLADQAVVVPGPVTDALGDVAPEHRDLRRDRRRGAGAARVDDLQHDAVPRTGRDAARQAPQADAHRLRAHGLGDGRRLDPAGGRHAATAGSAG